MGKPKKNDADILQLVAQAICLEEMLLCSINKGYLFYHEIRRRIEVPITDELRMKVKSIVEEMHDYFKRKHTPRVRTGSFCKKCSLQNACLPGLMIREKASSYIDRMMEK